MGILACSRRRWKREEEERVSVRPKEAAGIAALRVGDGGGEEGQP